jgi:hypothetical protein
MRNDEKSILSAQRAERGCPADLRQFIERVNALKTTDQLPEWNAQYQLYTENYPDEYDAEDIKGIDKMGIKYLFGELLEELANHLAHLPFADLYQQITEKHQDYFSVLGDKVFYDKPGFKIEITADLVKKFIDYIDRELSSIPSDEVLGTVALDRMSWRIAIEASLQLSAMINSVIKATRRAYNEKIISLETKDRIADGLKILSRYGVYKHYWLSAIHEYLTLVETFQARDNFRQIIIYNAGTNFLEQGELWLLDARANLRVIDSKIQVCRSPFFQAIEGIDINKIKACPICEHIFWAARKDSKTCSAKCYNTFRQRCFRERNVLEINAKRRANYAYRNQIGSLR